MSAETLQQIAPAGARAGAPAPEDLAELIGAFNEVTTRLQRTHETLRAQVSRLESELHDANEQLRRTERLAALGEMAAGIAHEVRNPLGSIRLYASMLADDLADRPAERETALKIASAVRGLDGVVGDVLSFARPISPQHDACTAQELFDDALAACAACLQREGIEVRREDAQRRPVAIECDGTLVRQALINVVRNAIEAIAGAGDPSRERTVTLDASRTRVREKAGDAAPMISLRVRDTGPGVTPEVVARMFNPFFTTRHTGTGLGLAIVHRIVDAHGGRVRVRNAPEGGAVVELLLPAEPGARSQRHDRDTETPTP